MISKSHYVYKNYDKLEVMAIGFKRNRMNVLPANLIKFYNLMGFKHHKRKRSNKHVFTGPGPDNQTCIRMFEPPHGKKAGSRYVDPGAVRTAEKLFEGFKLLIQEEGVEIL